MLGRVARGLPLGLALPCCMACCTCCCSWNKRRWPWAPVALFPVLTAVMVLTRKVNWYGLTPAQRSTPRPCPLPHQDAP